MKHLMMRGGWWYVVLLTTLIAPSAADASTYRWQVDASGDWNNPANWEVVEGPAGAGYPNLPGDVAVLDDGPLTANRQITIPDLVTVSIGRLLSENGNLNFGFTIDRLGTGLLVFDNDGEDATIEVTAGSQSFSTAVQLNANLVITGSVSFGGGISETGSARSLTSISGAVTMGTPANSYTGVTTIQNGARTSTPIPRAFASLDRSSLETATRATGPRTLRCLPGRSSRRPMCWSAATAR